jgi:hypothetical protein
MQVRTLQNMNTHRNMENINHGCRNMDSRNMDSRYGHGLKLHMEKMNMNVLCIHEYGEYVHYNACI